MEMLKSRSSWRCSQAIREKAYQILSASSIEGIPSVKEYDRDRKTLVLRNVKVDSGDWSSSLSLNNLYKQSEESRLLLFYHALGITDELIDAGVVSPSSLSRKDNDILTAMIIHWVNHCRPYACKM